MNQLNRCQPLLGTYVEILLQDDCSDDELIAISRAAYAEIELVQQAMSFHDPDSELSRINRDAHREPQAISTAMFDVLSLALSLSQKTNGDYDICVGDLLVKSGQLPEHHPKKCSGNWRDIELQDQQIFFKQPIQIDLGGIAKGYAVDRAMAVIPAHVKASINAGGDMLNNDWRAEKVMLRVPELKRAQVVQLAMKNRACATSASYYQLADGKPSVLLNPHTGQAIDKKCSITVFADSCILADALTKVAFASVDANKILQEYNATAVVIESSGKSHTL